MVKAYVCKAAEWVTRSSSDPRRLCFAEEYTVSRLFVMHEFCRFLKGADETLCSNSLPDAYWPKPSRHNAKIRFLDAAIPQPLRSLLLPCSESTNPFGPTSDLSLTLEQFHHQLLMDSIVNRPSTTLKYCSGRARLWPITAPSLLPTVHPA